MNSDIVLKISESIKTGKWLSVKYNNQNDEITYFWCVVCDINLKSRKIKAKIFNDYKSSDCLDTYIQFERILQAEVLEFTTFPLQIKLIEKIEKNRIDSAWLKYEEFNNNILKYFIKCSELDNDPYQKESFLIKGVDRNTFLKNKRIKLTDNQIKEVIDFIERYDGKKYKRERNELILSLLSIDVDNKKYVIIYQEICFNPDNKSLSIESSPRVNQSFLIKEKRYSLSAYIEMDVSEFVKNIHDDFKKYYEEYKELIRENLRSREILNERPEFLIMQRNLPVNLESTYSIIEEKYLEGKLTYPLKAFFGNTSRYGAKRNEPSIVIYDRRVNIDQMRVIYNTIKYPITYVQGPPGTGKTQTILNVILSAFFNERTVLVCASNNKPVDGIIEKLSFTYKVNGDVPFPYIRLGNRDEIALSTARIKRLSQFTYHLEPNDSQLEEIKNRSNRLNKKLVDSLEMYETRRDLKDKIKSAKRLLSSISNENARLYKSIKNQIEDLENELNSIPEVTNDGVLDLVISASEDRYFKQYLYFESLKHINKLKLPRYKELIDICSIEDEEERVTNFNKWCQLDSNIKLLEDVFPIIVTTNISSARLGSANHTFDLVIMDEAGQSNCATALLPIARANSLLLVGDSNQLKPVVVLEDNINNDLKEEYQISSDYDYKKYSILELMRNKDKISRDIMLTYHYRCGKKIIKFSNERFYDSKLNLDFLKEDGDLALINVKNINSKNKNENYEEAVAIVDYIKKHNLSDVAIITPFVNQEQLITNMLKRENITDVTCGTIHSIQGAEKDTIIISTSISPKTSRRTFEWIKNNAEITNVAVTRAKKNLIVVSDVEAMDMLSKDKKDDLYNLVQYVKSNGTITVPKNENISIQIGNSNASKNEDMFYETISHFCSVYTHYTVKRNVKVASLFNKDPILSKTKQEFDLVLYTKFMSKITPKIVIELQGGEHYGNIERENCDIKKVEICKEKNIKILFIPNSFAKSYESIARMILDSCGVKYEQLEMLL